eukprot:jgi/Orpsp1_1/1182260/evm.model.c7180000080522.1
MIRQPILVTLEAGTPNRSPVGQAGILTKLNYRAAPNWWEHQGSARKQTGNSNDIGNSNSNSNDNDNGNG